MEPVGTHEAKTRLSEYINRVRYGGERVLIERRAGEERGGAIPGGVEGGGHPGELPGPVEACFEETPAPH